MMPDQRTSPHSRSAWRPHLGKIFAAVSILLLAHAAYNFWSARNFRADFEHELSTPIAAFQVALAKPGVVTLPFELTYPYGHGLALILESAPDRSVSSSSDSAWLDQLEASVQLSNHAGPISEPIALFENPYCGYFHDRLVLALLDCTDVGSYSLNLTIRSTLPAAPSNHRLLIHNKLCGCEMIIPFFCEVFAVIEIVLALIFAIAASAVSKSRLAANPSGAASNPTATAPQSPPAI